MGRNPRKKKADCLLGCSRGFPWGGSSSDRREKAENDGLGGKKKEKTVDGKKPPVGIRMSSQLSTWEKGFWKRERPTGLPEEKSRNKRKIFGKKHNQVRTVSTLKKDGKNPLSQEGEGGKGPRFHLLRGGTVGGCLTQRAEGKGQAAKETREDHSPGTASACPEKRLLGSPFSRR